MKFQGNLVITRENQDQYKSLVEVTGNLYVHGGAKLEALTTVGGNLYVYGGAKLEALTTVGGYLYVHGGAKLEAPALKNSNNEEARREAKRALDLSFAAHGQALIDGILSWNIGKKQIGEIVAYEIRVVGKSEVSFAVQRGEHFSHGATIEQAIRDLRYKLSDRDTSRFKSWTLETVVSIDDAIQSYRAITGACELGTKHFCDGQDLPDAITIAEVIRRTKGQYRHEAYKSFFELRGEK